MIGGFQGFGQAARVTLTRGGSGFGSFTNIGYNEVRSMVAALRALWDRVAPGKARDSFDAWFEQHDGILESAFGDAFSAEFARDADYWRNLGNSLTVGPKLDAPQGEGLSTIAKVGLGVAALVVGLGGIYAVAKHYKLF